MPSWEAIDGQRDGNRYRAVIWEESDKNSQIRPTLGWNTSAARRRPHMHTTHKSKRHQVGVFLLCR